MCFNRLRSYLLRYYSRLSGTVLAEVGNQALSNSSLGKKRAGYTAIVPISDVDKLAIHAINYSKTVAGKVVAVHVCIDSVERERMKKQWDTYVKDVPLIMLDPFNGSIVYPIIDFIDKTLDNHRNAVVVAMPELVLEKWWHRFLHNQTAKLIKKALQLKKGIIITSIPFKVQE